MSTVQTVTGEIDADELGLTLIHEHFFSSDEAVSAQWPHIRDRQQEHDLAVESAEAVKGHGVRTVVEPTAMLLGRDVQASRELAEETGLQIVLCTGIYTYDYLPQFLANRDADFIASLFVHDIENGIQGTDVKAAFIKCAADEPGVTPNIEKIHRAAARASLQTGAPIMAHSRPASGTGPRQVEIFLEEGVPPERIQIAHTGDTDDLGYIEGLLESGVCIGMDRYGLDLFLPTAARNATFTKLLNRGYEDRMFISQDFDIPIANGLDWYPPEVLEQLQAAGAATDWGMTFIFEEVLPALSEAGMTDQQRNTILVENPKRWLTAS
ncbi:MAG: phosphotriesterase [Solirubrobacterales bacterium]|nr:phosphotriesterase [Solirubrobacterales bacterium]MCB8915167.1 phosphotriesterase [Thermoleophilales bacterium]